MMLVEYRRYSLWKKLFSSTKRLIKTNYKIFKEKELRQKVMLCAIWYHLYSLKNVKNNDREVLLLVKLKVSPCNSTKSDL